MTQANNGQTKRGYYGEYGGRFVPEGIAELLAVLERAFDDAVADGAFQKELDTLLAEYVGRPSAITECVNLSEEIGRAHV